MRQARQSGDGKTWGMYFLGSAWQVDFRCLTIHSYRHGPDVFIDTAEPQYRWALEHRREPRLHESLITGHDSYASLITVRGQQPIRLQDACQQLGWSHGYWIGGKPSRHSR